MQFGERLFEVMARAAIAADALEMHARRHLNQRTQENLSVVLRSIPHLQPGGFPFLMSVPMFAGVEKGDAVCKMPELLVGKYWLDDGAEFVHLALARRHVRRRCVRDARRRTI